MGTERGGQDRHQGSGGHTGREPADGKDRHQGTGGEGRHPGTGGRTGREPGGGEGRHQGSGGHTGREPGGGERADRNMATSGQEAPVRRLDGGDLLRRAIAYALPAIEAVTPGLLCGPTPCRAWTLGTLIGHVSASLAALHEAIATGHLSPEPPGDGDAPGALGAPDDPDDPVAGCAELARRLFAACEEPPGDGLIVVGDLTLAPGIVAATGAVEVAVHGWDIAHACGTHHHIPPNLAADLLEICPHVVPPGSRPLLFAAQVPVPPATGPGGRLVAFLGRTPCPSATFDIDERLAAVVSRLLGTRPGRLAGGRVGRRDTGNDDLSEPIQLRPSPEISW